MSVDGQDVRNIRQLQSALEAPGGHDLVVRRLNENRVVKIQP